MKSNQAADYFHGKEGYNCVQAVLKAFQPESGMSDSVINSAKVAGGGRAPDGVCGALYAAQILLGEDPSCSKVSRAFEAKYGSLHCSDLKKDECGCRKLVQKSADLTNSHIGVINGLDPIYSRKREVREIEMLPPQLDEQVSK